MGTLTRADVYGLQASPLQYASPISAGGPDQSIVAPAFSAPGTVAIGSGPAPAFSLLGLVLALVALRVAIELSDQA